MHKHVQKWGDSSGSSRQINEKWRIRSSYRSCMCPSRTTSAHTVPHRGGCITFSTDGEFSSVSLIRCSLASAGSHHYFSQCFKVLEDLLHRSTVSWDSSVQAPSLVHHLLSRSTRRSMLTVLKQYHRSQPESGQAVSLFLSSGQDSFHVVTLVCLQHIVAKFYCIFYPTARIGRVPVLLYNNVQLA